MLTERLLQFIWQFQYFNKRTLFTSTGESLQILHPGSYNTNQGPDFLQAKIKIDNTIWAGNIELHILASDWFQHRHDEDKKYDNVILHVVWEEDKTIGDKNSIPLHTLVLEPLVSKLMLEHYEELMHAQGSVPCQSYLPLLSSIGWQSWQERLLIERLQKRAALIFQQLNKVNNHWEEVFWRLLARNFGLPINGDAFESMAETIPVALLAKYKNQIQQLEGLLLGQAGLLEEETSDSYVLLLKREHRFLQNKYNLLPASIRPVFLRMRPANFPTIRLAQLAMLVHQSEHLFSKIVESEKADEVIRFLNVTANDFWHYHYQLHVASDYKPKVLGEEMVTNILINTVVPAVFAYGLYHNNQTYKDKALDWLSRIKPEQNNVIKNWRSFGVKADKRFANPRLARVKETLLRLKKMS